LVLSGRRLRLFPAIQHDIELTDQIKEYIMNNRIYRVPVEILPCPHGKKKKATISKSLRIAVWDTYCGIEKGVCKCYCCETMDIRQMDFVCGHVVAEASGGPTTLHNLRPICTGCNQDMQTTNLYEFKKRFIKNIQSLSTISVGTRSVPIKHDRAKKFIFEIDTIKKLVI